MADRNSTHGRVTGSVELKKRKRGDVYYLRYRLPSGKQVMKKLGPAAPTKGGGEPGTFTKRQAEDALKELITDVRRGAISDPGDTSGKTLADAVAMWLLYVQHDKARKPSTVRGYRQVGGLLEAEFGADTPIEEITTEKVDDYRSRLLTEEDGVSRRTVQQRLVLLRGVMQRAKVKGWITVNPVDAAEKVNVPRTGEFNVLSVEQVEAVARRAEPMFGAAIVVAAYTGLRTGELRALRWRDIDFKGSALRVVRNMPIGGEEGAPKSGKPRSVPLIDQAARALDALSKREAFTGDDDRIFVNEVGGMLGDDALRDALYDAMKAAGIERLTFPAGPFRFHDLRHCFGTLAARIFPLVDVQAFMGHAQIETTMIYAHSVPRNDAARRFTEAVEAASGAGLGTESEQAAEMAA
jgi:integrase